MVPSRWRATVFYRTTGDWLAWRLFDGSQWHGEEVFNEHHQRPTRMSSAPSVVAGWGPNRYAVFFRGDGDRLHWKAHEGGRWHGHAELEGGGVLTSDPSAVRLGLGALGVFYRTAEDWLAWRLYDSNSSEWAGEEVFNGHHPVPTGLGGGFLGPSVRPAVVAGWNGNRFGVFFRGDGDRLHWKAHQGARWHSHAVVDGGRELTSDPFVVSS